MSATVRAKFVVQSVKRYGYVLNVEVVLQPVYSPDPTSENYSFWNATPQGSLTMTITNPAASDQFVPGDEFYLDFTPVPKSDSSVVS